MGEGIPHSRFYFSELLVSLLHVIQSSVAGYLLYLLVQEYVFQGADRVRRGSGLKPGT